jgi:hypothetical protein
MSQIPISATPESIVINGRSVATADLKTDASGSNYILIRTKGDPLNKSQKDQLRGLGVQIHEFVGNETEQIYLCGYQHTPLDKIRGLDFVDYANVYATEFAVPDVLQTDTRAAAAQDTEETERVEVDVLLHHDITKPSEELLQKIAQKAGVDQSAISVGERGVRINVDPNNLDRIAAVDEVRVIHKVNKRGLFNNIARRILHVDDAVTTNNGVYQGNGQIVCVADTGFDKGSTTDVLEAFSGGRVKKLFAWGRDNMEDDPDGHGTHVCGSVLGSGPHSSQGLIQGTAPAATLIVQSTFSRFDANHNSILGGIPQDFGKLFDQAYKADARIHTNSWGTPLPLNRIQQPYDGAGEFIDKFVWDHQDMTILFAAGNDGQDSDLDGKVNERSLGAEAAAKNCITVGASENKRPDLQSGVQGLAYTYGRFWPNDFPKNPLRDDHQANNPEGLVAFSSRGPTKENRLKPDVVAPGTAILSARSRNKRFLERVNDYGDSGDDRYMYESGTSMATPLVAGCCAVLREMLMDSGYEDENNGVKNPTGSLIKALLVNGAVLIKGQYMPKEVGDEPNPHSGFGRVDLSGSFFIPGDVRVGYSTGVVTEENEVPVTIPVDVPEANLTLKVTMVYADLPGGALSNDLNLVVVAGDRERHGNQLNQDFIVGSATGFDRVNNVEQVVWKGITAATVQIVVKPYRLNGDPQISGPASVPFACVWRFTN